MRPAVQLAVRLAVLLAVDTSGLYASKRSQLSKSCELEPSVQKLGEEVEIRDLPIAFSVFAQTAANP